MLTDAGSIPAISTKQQYGNVRERQKTRLVNS